MTFEIGDRVRAVRNISAHKFIHAGYEGTVCDVGRHVGRHLVGVAWDKMIYGHNCNGRCLSGHGFYVHRVDIELVDDEAGLIEVDTSAILSLLNV